MQDFAQRDRFTHKVFILGRQAEGFDFAACLQSCHPHAIDLGQACRLDLGARAHSGQGTSSSKVA